MNTEANVRTGEAGMQQRLGQCAELERSLFPPCFSVLLRPRTQITCTAFDAGRKEPVQCAIPRSLSGNYDQRRAKEPRGSQAKIVH